MILLLAGSGTVMATLWVFDRRRRERGLLSGVTLLWLLLPVAAFLVAASQCL